MNEAIKQVGEVVKESIVQNTGKHVANAAAGGTAVTASPDYLGIAALCLSILVSCAIFYKTMLEIKQLKDKK